MQVLTVVALGSIESAGLNAQSLQLAFVPVVPALGRMRSGLRSKGACCSKFEAHLRSKYIHVCSMCVVVQLPRRLPPHSEQDTAGQLAQSNAQHPAQT